MGRVIEKVVAEQLSLGTERRQQLSNGQFGPRTWRSAIDTAAIMDDRAYVDWMDGHISGVLPIDMNAAFPRMAKERLVN
jgi:hypothetical protein